MKLRVKIITPIRDGGTKSWGRDLATALNTSEPGMAVVESGALSTFGAMFSVGDSSMVHSVIPLPFHLWRKPFLLALHGDFRQENTWWTPLYESAVRRAAGISVPSEYLRDRMKVSRAVVLPNGLHLDQYPYRPSERESGAMRFLTATNFSIPQKAEGVHALLDVVQTYARSHPAWQCTFTVLGDGPLRTSFIQKAQAQCPTNLRIDFPGWKSIASYFSQSDVYLYHSSLDSFGLTLIEAMASGIPVLTNDFGPTREIIHSEKTGYICDTTDAYLQVLDTMTHTVPLDILQQARQDVEQRFDWRVLARRYLDFYRLYISQ